MSSEVAKILIPGKSVLGVMGSGQLGRMFAQKALERGYTVKCYSPDTQTPAGKVGALETIGEYSDSEKLEKFLKSIDALTFEFENIPEEALDTIERITRETRLRVSPSVDSIRISQNRFKEKEFFNKHFLETAPFLYLPNLGSLYELMDKVRYPVILKTNRFGYDGKGQGKFENFHDLEAYLKKLPYVDHILEKLVKFSCEISVVACRFENGKILSYLPSENIHKNHILDISIHPARINNEVKRNAMQAVERLLKSLDYVGVLALELFVVEDRIICNEFAPRPHNSGHFSMDAARISQFELQLLTLCNLELTIDTLESTTCIMKNIIGFDFMENELVYTSYLKSNNYRLHLYQKSEAKKGRKMGHWNYLGNKDFQEAFP